jgi:flagellar basal-body rod protein FlgF
MIKGLYAAASAMVTGVNRQKILAHNAANVDTPGFKEILTSLDDFENTSVVFSQDGISGSPMHYVGNLGLGVQSGPDVTDYTEGGLKSTGHAYDFSINGSGFFRIKTPSGERYTRDGRFIRDVNNNLVTVDGYQVLDSNGQAIKLPEGDPQVSSDGTIMVNGAAAGKIGIAAFKDPGTSLVRDEHNNFSAKTQPDTTVTTGLVRQGYLEMSNVNPSVLMTQMVTVARAYEAAQQMVQNQDELLGQSISTLGRLS